MLRRLKGPAGSCDQRPGRAPNPDGLVLFAQGKETGELRRRSPDGGTDQAPAPSWWSDTPWARHRRKKRALKIYFEGQRTAVTPTLAGATWWSLEVGHPTRGMVKRLRRPAAASLRPGEASPETTRQVTGRACAGAAHITRDNPPLPGPRRIIRGRGPERQVTALISFGV